MAGQNNIATTKERLRKAVAAGLLRAAVYLHTQHMQRLSVSSPHESRKRTHDTAAGPKGSSYLVYTDPARPGEYPKLRTGQGQKSTWYESRSVGGIIAEGLKVRVGYKPTIPGSNHLLALEHRGWKGLKDTLESTRPQLAALVGAAFQAGMTAA